MLKKDEKILSYLKPIEYQYETDTYFVGENKYQKDWILYARLDKIREFVVKNGGTFKQLTRHLERRRNEKGYIIQIRFPSYCKRDMKNIMATLY